MQGDRCINADPKGIECIFDLCVCVFVPDMVLQHES